MELPEVEGITEGISGRMTRKFSGEFRGGISAENPVTFVYLFFLKK